MGYKYVYAADVERDKARTGPVTSRRLLPVIPQASIHPYTHHHRDTIRLPSLLHQLVIVPLFYSSKFVPVESIGEKKKRK